MSQSVLTLGTSAVRQLDGLYSLNDLHQASGGEEKHRPTFFLRNDQTKALIEEIGRCADSHIATKTKRGGQDQGTYVCRELVYAYAMWISPKFSLEVIRVFDAQHADKALPDYITPAQQNALQQIVADKNMDGKKRPYIWSRFNNHFKLGSYKQLPAAQFDEACEYLKNIPMKGETAESIMTHAERARAAITAATAQAVAGYMAKHGDEAAPRRYLVAFDRDMQPILMPVGRTAYIAEAEKFAAIIKEPGEIPLHLLPEIIAACAERLGKANPSRSLTCAD